MLFRSDPNDPKVIEQARADGVPENWLEAARHSPVYKMAVDWKVALPLHPEYGTRCSTVLLLGRDGSVDLEERSFDAAGDETVRVQWRLGKGEWTAAVR